MKRVGVVAMVAVIVMLGLTALAAQRETTTVSGELVSLNCYLKTGEEATGLAHKDHAVATARTGQPLAVLVGQEFYIIKGDWTNNKNERLLEWIASNVQVTGEVAEINGKKLMNVVDLVAAQ